MKIAYFASVLAMTAAVAVACDDSADRVTPRHVSATAGTASSAGKSGTTAGSANGGNGGSGNIAGTSGAPEGGAAGGDNAGGEPNAAGAGEAGATGNAGAGGAGGDGSGAPAPLELIGAYDDYVGDTVVGSFVITEDAWGSSALAAYDNAANIVYTQFPANDPYSPNKFAKTVYTEPANNSFYYCMVVFSAETLAEAQASTATADTSDPEHGGCGGIFPWSKATKK
jgi:hypothetical protein